MGIIWRKWREQLMIKNLTTPGFQFHTRWTSILTGKYKKWQQWQMGLLKGPVVTAVPTFFDTSESWSVSTFFLFFKIASFHPYGLEEYALLVLALIYSMFHAVHKEAVSGDAKRAVVWKGENRKRLAIIFDSGSDNGHTDNKDRWRTMQCGGQTGEGGRVGKVQ